MRFRMQLALVAVALVFVAVGAANLLLGRSQRGYTHTYGSRVVHYRLTSRLLHAHEDEVAIVPPGAGPHRLLVLLHGRHDPRRTTLGGLLPQQTGPESLLSDALLRALHRLGPAQPVVVLVNGGGHSYYHDRRDGPWGSMVLQEAIPDAVRRFGTTGRPAIGGISMGGFGALHLAAQAPRTFCAVGVRSAAVWASAGATPAGAFDDAADFDRTDVFAAARAGRYRGLPVWIDDGDRDPFLAADTLLAHRLGAVFHTWPGGHDDAYWHAHLTPYLAFFGHACGWHALPAST